MITKERAQHLLAMMSDAADSLRGATPSACESASVKLKGCIGELQQSLLEELPPADPAEPQT